MNWGSRTIVALLSLLAITSAGFAAGNNTSYVAKYEVDANGDKNLIQISQSHSNIQGLEINEVRFPQSIEEHGSISKEEIVILTAKTEALLHKELEKRNVQNQITEIGEEVFEEVVTLVNSGPSENRIDVTFMGDGYTIDERQKFFDDMQRMVDDMFKDRTFKSYLPLFNVHVVFKPSNQSGIGRNDRAKDTAYRLYRAGNTLRAIYPGNKSALRSSCAKAPGCDYPVVIANDPNYGGLGGEFAVSTSSVTSGTKVLRHELGHNFGRVGEEYDGGGYFGANHSRSASRVSWQHWATDSVVRAEPSRSAFVAWPWHNLEKGPYTASFRTDGNYPYFDITLSASGMPHDSDLSIRLDDQDLTYTGPNTEDRMFHTYSFTEGLESGSHKLVLTEGNADGDNWVSNLKIQEYKADYHFDNEYVGAYPMFSKSGRVDGYRSNHEKCLMRNMDSVVFCSVCQENNWMEFFGRISMIDDVSVANGETLTTVKVDTLKIGQLYPSYEDGSYIEIRWYQNGVVQEDLNDLVEWSLPIDTAGGSWEVKTKFTSPEIRKNFSKFSDSAKFRI